MNTLILSLWMTLVAVSRSAEIELNDHTQRQAETLANLPSCVQNCLSTSFTTHGTDCSPTDFSCLCRLKPFFEACAKCYNESCNPEDQKSGTEFGLKRCASIGVNIPTGPIPNSLPPTTPTNSTPTSTDSVSVAPTTGNTSSSLSVSTTPQGAKSSASKRDLSLAPVFLGSVVAIIIF